MMDVTEDGSDGQSAADRRSSPPPPDLFEFFFDGLSIESEAEMCAADDIFHSGKLLPYKPPPPPCLAERSDIHEPKTHHLRHRRSESLGALDGPHRGIAAECRRLRRAASDSEPAPPPPARQRPRPRWYVFVFGSVRMPAAMEMRDIRSRQRRRCPTPPSTAEGGGWGFKKGRPPWRLLRSLSCKGLGGENDVVTAPLGSF